MSKRILWGLFKYLLALSLLGYVLYANWNPPGGNGLKDVWEKHVVGDANGHRSPIHVGFLLTALALYTVSLLLTLVRWYVLVRAQDLPFTLSAAIRYGLVGFFYNTFLPGSVGGDIIKAAAIARDQKRRTTAVSTVLMDRAIALWGLIWFVGVLGSCFWLLGLLDGPLGGAGKTIVTTMMVIVASTSLVWVLLGFLPERRANRFAARLSWLPKVGHSLAEVWLSAWIYRCRPRAVGLALVLSWIGHVGFVLGFYCSARVLWSGGPEDPLPSLVQHFLLVPIGMIISAMPLFPGGVGIGELGFGKLYTWFGSAASNGVLGSLVQRVIYWVIGFAGYLVYLRMRAPGLKAEKLIAEEANDEQEPPVQDLDAECQVA